MKSYFRVAIFIAVIAALILFSPFLRTQNQSGRSHSLAEVLRVFEAIEKVEAEIQQPWSGPFREIIITESELNSYIAYRIETEKEEIMKELRFKLLDKNRIEGKIHIDLRGQQIPQFIRPEMDFYFAADLQAASGKVKFDLKELFLGDEPIQPLIIDLIIAIAARLDKAQATSINDWYELPFGIKDVKTQKGKAIFYY